MPLYGIETPEEVQARINTERASLAQTTEGRDQVNYTQFAEALFGNPEVTRAKEQMAVVRSATEEANKLADAEGLSDDDAETAKLQTIRDRLESTNPGAATQIDKHLLQRRQTLLEEKKLQQEAAAGDISLDRTNRRFILNPDTLRSEEIDLSTVDGAQKAIAAREAGYLVSESEKDIVNVFDKERARSHTEQLKRETRAYKAMQDKLKDEANVFALTEPTRSALMKNLMMNQPMIDELKAAGELMNDPNMMSMSQKIPNLIVGAKQAINMGLISPEEGERYSRYKSMIARMSNAASELRHARFGGALTETEYELSKQFIPDASDTPLELIEKMNGLYDLLQKSSYRSNKALELNNYEMLSVPGEQFKDAIGPALFGPDIYNKFGKATPQQKALKFGTGNRTSNRTSQGSSGKLSAMDILNRESTK